MTGVVIGAGSDSIYGIKRAQSMKHKIIAFDGNEKSEGLKYADRSYAIDIKNIEMILKVLKETPPDFVLPIPIGRYLTISGRINDYFGLKGISEEACVLCTDKFLYHETLNKNGLRPIQCICMQHGHNMTDAIDTFPVVVKPRYGSGSRNVKIFNTHDEFIDGFVKYQPYDEDYIIESLYEGVEYGVDGAVINHKFELTLLRKKKITPPPYRQNVANFSVTDDKDNKELLASVINYIEKVTRALKMNNCLLNADIIVGKNNEAFAIEVTGRPAGHMLYNIFTKMASGVDLIEQYINFVGGSTYKFTPSQKVKKLLIRYFDFEECVIEKIPNADEVLANPNVFVYECNIEEGHLGRVTDGHSIMGRGFLVVGGDNEPDMMNTCEFVFNQFDVRNMH